MATLVDDLVPDQLWAIVQPLLPPPPAVRRPTPVIPDRACFAAIIYLARTSTPWRLLPARELGCGSPATAWRRLDEWANAGVFDQLHLDVLDRLGEQGRLDWTRASVDSGERARQARGIMLAQIPSIAASADPSSTWSATGRDCPLPRRHRRRRRRCDHAAGDGGRHPPIRTPSGRRRTRPGAVHTDKGYDSAVNRAWLRRRGIAARIARRGMESSARLGGSGGRSSGRCRGSGCRRRLQVRWDRDAGRWFAFVLVGLRARLRQPAGGQACRLTDALPGGQLCWTRHVAAAATASPGSAASSGRRPPAARWSTRPDRPARAAGR